MIPWSALIALVAPIAGRLADRYAPGLLRSIGLAVMCAAMVSLAALPMNPDTLGICIRMAVCGAGFGFFPSRAVATTPLAPPAPFTRRAFDERFQIRGLAFWAFLLSS